jgi:formylglycine-generating enzyme required for sulfatase activity
VDDACRGLDLLRREGRLVLLLDALDQAPPDGSAVDELRRLLADPDWKQCRIVVSGRPHALQRYWSELFDPAVERGWRFVQVDEFDERQQRIFLGDERYESIPAEARDILATPRVLEYLRDLPDGELAEIRTAGDAYWHSINHLLKTGLKGSVAARRIGLVPGESPDEKVAHRSYQRALQLLGAIAFAMTATRVHRNPGGDGTENVLVPNFDGVPPNRFSDFQDAVYQLLSRRPGEADRSRLQRDMDALSALNEFLEQGIFDSDVSGLDRILWRSRSLQAFFAAYWLAQYCSDEDAAKLWDWIVLPEQPLTEEYYWVWRFLCEMHDDAREPQAWTRAIESLFRPGDGTVEGTKRSCELMCRAWEPLNRLAATRHQDARRVRDAFLGEFENAILAGRRGDKARRIARQFYDSFIEVPAGEFRMGSPPENQGMPDDVRRNWTKFLEREGDPIKLAEQHLSQYVFSPGKQGQDWRNWELQWWTNVFRDRDLEAIARRLYGSDETPEEPVQRVRGFRLNRWPTINAWYRLFDPGHGLVDSWYRETYRKISPDAETPTIFVSWYDAWAFCVWAHWDGQSCRLPRECEWEYAAKAGTPWDDNYWWGDEFDPSKANADQIVGRTTAPMAEHANPWGFEDILGNVLEWCQDEYCRAYAQDKSPDSSALVVRGGSWNDNAAHVRCARRQSQQPTFTAFNVGFRTARAMHRMGAVSNVSAERVPTQTCYLSFSASEVTNLTVGDRLTLTLEVSPDNEPQSVPLELPTTALELTVYVRAPGFYVASEQPLTITTVPKARRKSCRSLDLIPVISGDQTVTAEVYASGRVADVEPALVSRTLTVAPPVALPNIPEMVDRRAIPDPLPDVILYVTLDEAPWLSGGQQLRMFLTCPGLGLDPWRTETPLTLTEQDLAGMRQAAIAATVQTTDVAPEDGWAALQAFGAMLFDQLVPRGHALREYFLTATQLPGLRSCLVISDERTFLPWELVVPYGQGIPAEFLAQTFILSHWVLRQGLRLAREAPLDQLDLTHYHQLHRRELQRWQAVLGTDRYVTIEDQAGHMALMEPDSAYYGLHVLSYVRSRQAGRITAADKSDLVGDDAERMIFNRRLDFTLRRPVVGLSFVDGEPTGAGLSLAERDHGLESGWVLPFMHAGATAVVGARWPVSAEADQQFFRAYYEAIRAGAPLGYAAWHARKQVQVVFPHRADWLAYVYFGHPQCEPYLVRPAHGFALVEILDYPEEAPLLAGNTYRFRISYRSEPPVWFAGRLRRPESTTQADDVSVTVMPMLEGKPMRLSLVCGFAGDDLQGMIELTMPNEETSYPVFVRFEKDGRELETLVMDLEVILKGATQL